MEGDNTKDLVRINISGRVFECLKTTFETFPESKLAVHIGNGSKSNTQLYFDRSSAMFEHILDSYRAGSVHFPRDVCASRFIEEVKFWGLSIDNVALCCWKTVCKAEDNSKSMTAMGKHVDCARTTTEVQDTTLRQKIWLLIESPRSSRLAYVWAIWMSLVICTSVFVTALGSVDSLKRNVTETEREFVDAFMEAGKFPKGIRNVYLIQSDTLLLTDMICFAFMTLEHILKVITCPNKLNMFKDILHWLEFIACLSFWGSTILLLNNLKADILIWMWIIMIYLTILKLARLFRITRHMAAFRVISLTLHTSKNEFGIFTVLLFLLTSLFGFTIYIAEYFVESKFDSIFQALYWAVITLTTVGYGDTVPSSPLGQVIASLCALCGILVLAMPAGIIVSKFHNFYAQHLQVKRYMATHNRPVP